MSVDPKTLEKCIKDGTPVKITLEKGGRYVFGRVRKLDVSGQEPRITVKIVRSNIQGWRLRKPKIVLRASQIRDLKEQYQRPDYQPNLKLSSAS